MSCGDFHLVLQFIASPAMVTDAIQAVQINQGKAGANASWLIKSDDGVVGLSSTLICLSRTCVPGLD